MNRVVAADAAFSVVHVAEVIKGGICTYLREVIALQRQSFGPDRVAVVIPAGQRGDLSVPGGVEVITFDDSGNRLMNALRLARTTRLALARLRPEVVHLHSTYAGAALRPLLALLRSRAAVIYCPHGWAFYRDTSPAVRAAVQRLERIWSRWCDAIVCVSEHEQQSAVRVGIPRHKLVVVQNGLPRESPAPDPTPIDWPAGVRRVLFVGRFDRQKGIDIVLDAVRAMGDDVFVYIAGDSLRTGLASLPPNARYAGWLNPGQLEAFYRSADVLVMPSRWEGFPLVAVEAMRAGLAVVASGVGGLPEVVVDGVTGTLLPAADVTSLVDALRSLDDRRLRQMGEAGRARFLQKLTIDEVHRGLCDIYRGTRQSSRPDHLPSTLNSPGEFGDEATRFQ